MSKGYWSTRRAAIKSGLSAGMTASIIGLGTSEAFATPVRAQSADSTWTESDQDPAATDALDLTISQATTTGWYGADWTNGAWRHIFRTESNSTCRGSDGYSASWIKYQSLGLAASNTENFTVSVQDKFHGVQPSPDGLPDTYDHSGVIGAIAEIAVSKLESIAGFAFTAAEIVDALVPDNQSTGNPDYVYEDHFDYAPDPQSDIGMYRWYYPFTNSEESTFDVICRGGNYAIGAEVQTSFTFHIKSDWTPKEGPLNGYKSTTEVGTTSAGTSLYRSESGWLVEEIPVEKIPMRASALPMASEHVEAHMNRDGEPLYFAHEAPIQLI